MAEPVSTTIRGGALLALLLCLAGCGEPQDAGPAAETVERRQAAAPDRVVAVVRSRGWLADMARQAGDAIYIHREPLVGDLVVVYARDTGASVSYLTTAQMDAREGTPPERRRRAVENLRTLLPDLSRDQVAEGVFALQGDPNYIPSLLLMDDIWRQQIAAVKGDLVAVVPTRQTILFTGTKNQGGVARMREMAAQAAAEATYPISELVIRRYGGKWIAFE